MTRLRAVDKAHSFGYAGKQIEIYGKHITMRVSKRDAYRLAMVCLAADPRWEMLPADWRKYFTRKKNDL
jgi:hypothetical protein